MDWKRQPQEQEGQKYFFNGKAYMTQGVRGLLTDEDAKSIIAELQKLAEEQGGLDYLQTYKNEKGQRIWIMDQLDEVMKPNHPEEHDYFTFLLPSEY